MTLFNSNSQYRENKAIWRMFETKVLTTELSKGYPWKWYAVNIPMDLKNISNTKGDIDLIAHLMEPPLHQNNEPPSFYRTWEVKVSLLDKEAKALSLKRIGRTEKIIKQMQKTRKYGAPNVSLLELFVLEDGFFSRHNFPPTEVASVMKSRYLELNKNNFGYQVLPFEHEQLGDIDYGLKSLSHTYNPFQSSIRLIEPTSLTIQAPFINLVKQLNDFYGKCKTPEKYGLSERVISFCKSCKELTMVYPDHSIICSKCGISILK